MGWVEIPHEVSYKVDNPEWERLDGLYQEAKVYEPTLKNALDGLSRTGSSACKVTGKGTKSETYLTRLSTLDTTAQNVAEGAVAAIKKKRDGVPQKLTKTRVETKREWRDSPSIYY